MAHRQLHSTQHTLEWILETFPDSWKLATALGNESLLIIDLLSQLTDRLRVFTIDTGRLPKATHELIEKVQERYGLELEVYIPDQNQVREMVAERGLNLFYDSTESRRLCCHVRKVEPLKRALADTEIWLSGIRREQSAFRKKRRKFELDKQGRIKAHPLLDWSTEQVWNYIYQNRIPYNRLYDRGYTSIGCEPCTRPIDSHASLREGRWWWERSNKKECGIHVT